MADQNWAVDELLKAEEDANNIIREAQRDREKRLKEAKHAAEQEISLYKKEKEDKYQEEIKAKFGTTKEDEELEKRTAEEIKVIKSEYEANKKGVIQMLIDRIVEVDIKIPQVLKGDFSSLD